MSEVAKKNIRGSALLLCGRGVSLALNMLTQVVTVRYLTKLDFGLVAFAVVCAELAIVPAVAGLDAALSKYVPVFQERHDHRRLKGALAIAFATVIALSLLVVLGIFFCRHSLAALLELAPTSSLVILIILARTPVSALNCLIESVIAAFADAWSILICKYLLGPIIKLGIVLLMIVTQQGILLLAGGYVAAAGITFVAYGYLLLRAFGNQGLSLSSSELILPFREMYSFGGSQLGADLAFIARSFLPAILLQSTLGMPAIADYWVVLPAARLNEIVSVAFSVLFMSACSRLMTRNDKHEVNRAYWRISAWITVLTFPLFLTAFACADSITGLLFGERYASSATVLSILSCGIYFHAILGLNGQALWVLGKSRWVVVIECIATLLAFLLYIYFIPRYGAVGAALATTTTMVIYTMLKQVCLLAFQTGIVNNWQHTRLTVVVVLCGVVLHAIKCFWIPPLPLGLFVSAVGCVLLIVTHRELLDIEDTFPELARIELVRRYFNLAAPASQDAS